MTDATTPPTPASSENVGRGALVALATIPIAVALFALVGGLFGFFAGIVAVVVPGIAAWLYEKGAGAPLTRRGWLPVIVITIVSVLLGILAGFIGTAYAAYSAVGGNREPFGPAFWTTLRLQLTSGDALIPIGLGLLLGVAGLIGLLRRPRAAKTATPHAAAPESGAPVAPAAPSPGVVLNGQPIDPREPPRS